MDAINIPQINTFPEVAVESKFPLLPLDSELSGNRYVSRTLNR